MSGIIEGFAVETRDDLIFTVKGLLHPPDRVIAYLRYLPDPAGERARDGVRYRRVYRFEEQEAILNTRYPVYLANDPVFGLRLQSVPYQLIRSVYDPRRSLAALRQRGPDDPLETDALALAQLIHETADVPQASLGISGSLMLSLHRPSSDLDLIVYGEIASRDVHQALCDLLHESPGPLRRPNPEELAALHAEHRPDTPLAFDAFARLQSRKLNELRFQGRETFIRFVRLPEESDERYGDNRFDPLRQVEVRARVTDDRDAIFTPCRYTVEDAALPDGTPLPGLREIVSFRGRFSDQVRAGEWAAARGSLERVTQDERTVHHRLVVGGRAGDYLLAQERGQ
jgi:predicted nucleotidyltransferase